MNKKKKPVTAKELMDRLRQDPDYVAWEEKQEEELREYEMKDRLEFQPLVDRLNSIGLIGNDIYEILAQNPPFGREGISILINSLNDFDDPKSQEWVIRSMVHMDKKCPRFSGRFLIDLFERSDDDALRFAILNTIALTKPTHIDDWLEKNKDNHIGKTIRSLKN